MKNSKTEINRNRRKYKNEEEGRQNEEKCEERKEIDID